MENRESKNPVYNRITLFGAMPPLKISLADRFIDEKKGNIAYSIPLFIKTSGPKRGDIEGKYEKVCDNYVKRAFWIAYELFEHAGLETLSDFYITTDSEMRERLEPYRQLCGFPEDHIILVPDVHDNFLSYMPKIVMLTRLASKTDYKYYVHSDTSLCMPVRCDFCQYFRENWEKHPESFVTPSPWLPEDNFFVRFGAKNVLSTHVDLERRSQFIAEIPRFFGEESYDYYLRRVLEHPIKCHGRFYGIPRNQILSGNWTEFLDFIAKTQCITLDEMFLALYWHKYLSPEKEYYRKVAAFQGKEVAIFGYDGQELIFEEGLFHYIQAGYKPTKRIQDFFVQHYQNLNRSQR